MTLGQVNNKLETSLEYIAKVSVEKSKEMNQGHNTIDLT